MYHVAGRMHHSVLWRPPVSDRTEGFTRRARRGRARALVQPAVLGPAHWQEAEDDEKDAVDLSWCKIDDAALDGLFEALKPSKIKQLWLNSARLLNPTCWRLRAHVRTRRSLVRVLPPLVWCRARATHFRSLARARQLRIAPNAPSSSAIHGTRRLEAQRTAHGAHALNISAVSYRARSNQLP